MANANNPQGFKPVQLYGGDPKTNVFSPAGYSIASAYGTTINQGDPVTLTGTSDVAGRPGLQRGAINDNVVGVFEGCRYKNALGDVIYSTSWPAAAVATEIVADVYDHYDTIFSIQSNGVFAQADVGNKADYVVATGTNGISAYQLDESTVGSQDGLIILALDTSANNSFGTNANVLVQLREHRMRGTGAAGLQVAF